MWQCMKVVSLKTGSKLERIACCFLCLITTFLGVLHTGVRPKHQEVANIVGLTEHVPQRFKEIVWSSNISNAWEKNKTKQQTSANTAGYCKLQHWNLFYFSWQYYLVLYCYFSLDPVFLCYTKECICFCFIAFTVAANMQNNNDWCSMRFPIFHDMISLTVILILLPTYFWYLMQFIISHLFLLPFSTFSTFADLESSEVVTIL